MDFEQVYLHIHGRKPSPEETKDHLRYDRLFKETELDPATIIRLILKAEDHARPSISVRELRAGLIGGLIVATLFCVATTTAVHPSVMVFVASNIAIAAVIFLFLLLRR